MNDERTSKYCRYFGGDVTNDRRLQEQDADVAEHWKLLDIEIEIPSHGPTIEELEKREQEEEARFAAMTDKEQHEYWRSKHVTDERNRL